MPFFVFDQRIALAGAQPREVFVQVLQKALETASDLEVEDAASCDADQCDLPEPKA